MVAQARHYQIRKYVVCDIIDGVCMDEQDVTIKMTPNCKECNDYKRWKESGLSIEEYLKKEYEDYLDESMPGWRSSR